MADCGRAEAPSAGQQQLRVQSIPLEFDLMSTGLLGKWRDYLPVLSLDEEVF
jgi:hypothetical protein